MASRRGLRRAVPVERGAREWLSSCVFQLDRADRFALPEDVFGHDCVRIRFVGNILHNVVWPVEDVMGAGRWRRAAIRDADHDLVAVLSGDPALDRRCRRSRSTSEQDVVVDRRPVVCNVLRVRTDVVAVGQSRWRRDDDAITGSKSRRDRYCIPDSGASRNPARTDAKVGVARRVVRTGDDEDDAPPFRVTRAVQGTTGLSLSR